MKHSIAMFALAASVLAMPFHQVPAQTKPGETMLAPRSKTAYEKHLAELNAKYGVDQSQDALKEAVLSANQAPP